MHWIFLQVAPVEDGSCCHCSYNYITFGWYRSRCPRHIEHFFSMTLTPMTWTFDPSGHLFGPWLLNTPSLAEIGQGELKILKFNLEPSDLDLEILKIFRYDLLKPLWTRHLGSLLGPKLTHLFSLWNNDKLGHQVSYLCTAFFYR